ncbi:MAG: hypothetical protein HY209_05485 [Candidatus Omnitrophica bacterium]|nr:hypothetical protein [Candidatus Omnitrophota bacterium]
MFNYIKEDSVIARSPQGDEAISKGTTIPRKYFSGGITKLEPDHIDRRGRQADVKGDGAMLRVDVDLEKPKDAAMNVAGIKKLNAFLGLLPVKEQEIYHKLMYLFVNGEDGSIAFSEVKLSNVDLTKLRKGFLSKFDNNPKALRDFESTAKLMSASAGKINPTIEEMIDQLYGVLIGKFNADNIIKNLKGDQFEKFYTYVEALREESVRSKSAAEFYEKTYRIMTVAANGITDAFTGQSHLSVDLSTIPGNTNFLSGQPLSFLFFASILEKLDKFGERTKDVADDPNWKEPILALKRVLNIDAAMTIDPFNLNTKYVEQWDNIQRGITEDVISNRVFPLIEQSYLAPGEKEQLKNIIQKFRVIFPRKSGHNEEMVLV